MPGGALAETQSQSAASHEGSRGQGAVPTGLTASAYASASGRPWRSAASKAAAAGASVSRMVLSPTVQRPRRASPSAAARSIAATAAPSRVGASSARGGGFQEGCAVERTRRAPDRGDESVPDGPQQLPGECLVWELLQQRVHRPKADHEVVAVIAVAKDRVEAGEVRRRAARRRSGSCPSAARSAAASIVVVAGSGAEAGALTVGRV